MSKFHALEVAAVKLETNDAVSISFKIPDSLKNEFQYKQGQYLTLQATVNGEDIRRAYSLCSSPVTNELPTVTCKKVEGGRMSNFLFNEIKPGSTINVMAPEGRFYTEMNAANSKHYILVGGGSGITPLYSIIKTVLLKEPESTCTLIYGNRNTASIIFREDLEKLVAQYPGKLEIVHSLDTSEEGWTGETGLLTADKIAQIIKKVQVPGTVKSKGFLGMGKKVQEPVREYFLCGPEGLMQQAQIAFKNLNLPGQHVHIEFFNAPVGNKKEDAADSKKIEDATASGGSKVIVMMDGKERELIINDRTTILHAAIKAGIDAPFSCEAGICSTCMAKVLEGTVSMDENNILSDEEVKKGYILSCQAHPTSKLVRIEFYD